MNWTDAFADEFRSYCGYDLKLYLPLIAGHVVDNIDASNAFLADFRKTIGHLVATNHYARFAEHAHQHNMGIQPESAGPHAGPLDGIKDYGFSDIVMSEFWSPSPHRPRPQEPRVFPYLYLFPRGAGNTGTGIFCRYACEPACYLVEQVGPFHRLHASCTDVGAGRNVRRRCPLLLWRSRPECLSV